MWSLVVQHFKSYAGWGLIFFFYLGALVWLFITEKRKERRVLFVYLPLILLILFFNPLTAYVMGKYADGEIYYRLLWLLPVTITLADALTQLVIKVPGKIKVFVIAASCALIVFSGKLIYTDERFSLAENVYHVPDEVVEICDAIILPGREVCAAFPDEHIVYVRQYMPYVDMPFGWYDSTYGDRYDNELRAYMERDVLDLDAIGVEAEKAECHYVVIDNKKESTGSLLEQGYEVFMEVGDYTVYKNPRMNFTIWL